MNYLVRQGYPSAAVSFAKEANLSLSKESVDSITARMEIRNKIHAGEIEAAIHDINNLNPQVFISLPKPILLWLVMNHNSVLMMIKSFFSLQNELNDLFFILDYKGLWLTISCSTAIRLFISHYYDYNSSNSFDPPRHRELRSSRLYHLQPNNLRLEVRQILASFPISKRQWLSLPFH